jgi:hypothetical protein
MKFVEVYMEHLLIRKAFKYDVQNSIDEANGSTYDSQKGFWKNSITGDAIINDAEFHPKRTKKADVETGEDKKGE